MEENLICNKMLLGRQKLRNESSLNRKINYKMQSSVRVDVREGRSLVGRVGSW